MKKFCNKISWLAIGLLFAGSLSAQQVTAIKRTVTIEVTGLPASHSNDPLFITGNYNNWKVADWQLRKNEAGNYVVTLPDISLGLLEFKFNRGDWKRLECTTEGRLADPHKAVIINDTLIRVKIEGWRDDYPVSTASSRVKLLDSAFHIPQLGIDRKIWIYLPKGYETGKQRYPVLYMQDGQALFDEATSSGRTGPVEWGVDEVLDNTKNPCIVVAINHNDDRIKRITEYYFKPNPEYDAVQGKEYLDFIVKTLKPHIDKEYRTHTNARNTFMAGSSMGGLITLYAGLYYPEVFGKLGVLSPSIWLDYDNSYAALNELKTRTAHRKQQYYFYAGGNENRMKPDSSHVEMKHDVTKTIAIMKQKITPAITLAVNPEGRHGPWYWSLAFPAFYSWLMER